MRVLTSPPQTAEGSQDCRPGGSLLALLRGQGEVEVGMTGYEQKVLDASHCPQPCTHTQLKLVSLLSRQGNRRPDEIQRYAHM